MISPIVQPIPQALVTIPTRPERGREFRHTANERWVSHLVGVQSFYLNRGKLGKNVADGTIPYRRDAVLSHDAEWFHFWVRAKTPKRWNSSIYFGSVHYGRPEKWAKWTNFEYNQVGYIFFLGLKTSPEVFKYTRSPSPATDHHIKQLL